MNQSINEYISPTIYKNYCWTVENNKVSINKIINREITQDDINSLHDKDYYIKMLYNSIKQILF